MKCARVVIKNDIVTRYCVTKKKKNQKEFNTLLSHFVEIFSSTVYLKILYIKRKRIRGAMSSLLFSSSSSRVRVSRRRCIKKKRRVTCTLKRERPPIARAVSVRRSIVHRPFRARLCVVSRARIARITYVV